MKRDIDQLYTARGGGRRGGWIVTACNDLVKLLRTGKEGTVIAWPMPRFGWIAHIRPTLQQVLREEGIEFTWKHQTELEVGPNRVLFISLENLDRPLRADYIVDDQGEAFSRATARGRRNMIQWLEIS